MGSHEPHPGELDGKIGDFKITIEGRATTQANWKKLVNGDASAMRIFCMAVSSCWALAREGRSSWLADGVSNR